LPYKSTKHTKEAQKASGNYGAILKVTGYVYDYEVFKSTINVLFRPELVFSQEAHAHFNFVEFKATIQHIYIKFQTDRKNMEETLMRAHHKKQFGVGLDSGEPRLSDCVDQLYKEKGAVVLNVDAYRRRATMDVSVDNHYFIHQTWVQDSLLHMAR
jgi:hypothetical protein